MGEIRDEESVDALMRLSSSGHRAISTLHTNSVCAVPNRFLMFKAQPFVAIQKRVPAAHLKRMMAARGEAQFSKRQFAQQERGSFRSRKHVSSGIRLDN
jgi:type II secretory ATPase GspE/PulE/Tfp pilus assembly ATPase PilB-like protein